AEALDKTNDPVRLYLREMATVPLLTREGEIEIAKRFERGHLRILQALSRSPVVIRAVMASGDDLGRAMRSIKEISDFDEVWLSTGRPTPCVRFMTSRAIKAMSESFKRNSRESVAASAKRNIAAASGRLLAGKSRYPGSYGASGLPMPSASASLRE